MNLPSYRITSIDLIRGLVMIIMALDHVRDFFHNDVSHDPLDLQTTTPLLFFTRWITHYCAPVFVFLSGTSAYLMGLRKTKKDLSLFLISRGLWLILVEFAVISLGWSFNPFYHVIPFQVIAAIGVSMIFLGLLVQLPYTMLLLLALVIVCGHNLLDEPEAIRNYNVGFWWDILHAGGFHFYEFAPGHSLLVIYPFVPWLGLMTLGYCFGKMYEWSWDKRKKALLLIGTGMILLFVLIRFADGYGDPLHWSAQKNPLYTFLSFISVKKYPPSLDFVLMTIGPALILLALTEQVRNKFTEIISVFGRVPFFYYILHIYLIHLLTVVLFFATGHSFSEHGLGKAIFLFRTDDMGFGLGGVYLVWVLVIVLLYPLCRWYDNYRRTNIKWWLSYL